MDVLHDRCAGLDIGKKDLKACVRTPSPTRRRSRCQEIRTFSTTTNALLELREAGRTEGHVGGSGGDGRLLGLSGIASDGRRNGSFRIVGGITAPRCVRRYAFCGCRIGSCEPI
jgi:hypothetical protein